MDYPSRDEFAGHLNSSFVLTTPTGEPCTVTLIEVCELVVRPRQEQYSLVFAAPADASLEQDLYDLSHPELGRMSLVLVPVARGNRGLELEAVFNRLTD
jgi:hypothetical protein